MKVGWGAGSTSHLPPGNVSGLTGRHSMTYLTDEMISGLMRDLVLSLTGADSNCLHTAAKR